MQVSFKKTVLIPTTIAAISLLLIACGDNDSQEKKVATDRNSSPTIVSEKAEPIVEAKKPVEPKTEVTKKIITQGKEIANELGNEVVDTLKKGGDVTEVVLEKAKEIGAEAIEETIEAGSKSIEKSQQILPQSN